MGETAWCASLGGGVHESYTRIGRGERLAELSEYLAKKPLNIGPVGDRIPTMCPKMRAHGVCRLPSCPYRHEPFRKSKSASKLFGGVAKEYCQDVLCRFAVALGSCPYGGAEGSCGYCHARDATPPLLSATLPPPASLARSAGALLLGATLPGPVPGTGCQDGTPSEAPRSEAPTLRSAAASAVGSRVASRAASRPPSGQSAVQYACGSRPCSAQQHSARRPTSAASRASAGSRGGFCGSARSSSSTATYGGLGRRLLPALGCAGWSDERHTVLSGKVPPLDFKANCLLFRGGC